MGQQQSQTASREPVVRRPPSRPTAPPSARPVSDLGPKGPSYNNPVNKVLPAVLPTKHQLRPVSQEMSKIIPNYKDIYAYDDDDDDDNDSLETNHVMDHELSNGKMPHSNGSIPNGKMAHSETGSVASDSSSSGRTQSVSFDPARKYKVHRRQQSATSSLYSRENTIEEESKESLELRGKLDSMSTSCPQVSIPVRSTFEMDSSLNMTYAQLAEARRNKTLSMIEQKTGKRIEDLSNDLSEHTSRPVTNLVRSNSAKSTKSMDALDGRKKKQRAPAPPVNRPPAPPAPVTSKSAPSTPRGPIRSMSQQVPKRPANPPPVYNRGYSVQFEPPADYDMEDISIPPPPPLQGILKTSKSYPKPRSNNVEYVDSNGTENNDRQMKERKPPSRTNSQRVPPIVAPIRQEDPLLLEIQRLAEKKAARRQMSEENEKEKQRVAEEEREKAIKAEEEKIKQKAAEKELVAMKEKAADHEKSNTTGASKDTEPNLVFLSGSVKPPLQKQDAVEEGLKVPPPPPPPEMSAPTPNSTPGTTLERKPSTTSSSSSADSAMRRLSSLLQHDIKIAAQAKATKIVKKSTKVKEKPKDPAEVFREQLAKAASDREKRSKTEMSIDELMKKKREEENNVPVTGKVVEKETGKQNVFTSDKLVMKKQESNNVKKPKEVLTLDLDTNEYSKPRFEKKSKKKESKVIESNGSLAKNSRQRPPESEPEDEEVDEVNDVRNSSIYTREDWTPCDDLDSDDNLSDKDQMVTSRGYVQGFKSTIVPNKVNDLKIKEKKGKGKENKYTKRNSEMGTDDRRKYDSIKRFKKTVHKSVRNAFGSISKAGGKILNRQKSEDLEVMNEPPPPPPNWKLRSSVSAPQGMNQNLESEQALKYMVPHGFSDHNSDSSDDEDYGKMRVNFGPEVDQTDEDEDSEKEEIHQMKRAGVAYIGKKGQIVVLPEYENVSTGKDRKNTGEFEGHAPKIYQKKKKFTFDDTVRKKERLKREEMLKEEVKREEGKREEERLKGEVKEKEMERVREMEARERLQRLETQAQIQQQLLQQQQMGILSAPPLPPPAGFQQGYNASVDYSQLLSQSNLPQSGFNIPFGSQPMFSAPMYSGMPNMSLEDFSQYMRMMGMQGSAPNPQQQYAFMLNSVNLANQGGFDRMQGGGLLHMLGHQDSAKYFKTSSQEYLDSDRNQVFNNWVGPTKQPASKATVVPTPQIVQSSGGMTVSSNSVTVSGPRVSTHSGGQIRTNIMVNDDESDTSDGLSPQNAALASAAAATTNEGPTIISGFGGDGGHRTKISVSGLHNQRGCNRQTSFSSVSSQPGSETSAER
ncbi:nucleolar protein dao-5-like [Pecten maximus]|uniref:nucleolar protein dao-5-like n=1 Tax=Pecten maximus TaxID=6579 RepID=UPI001458A168|nr:nucleolar protein dao-5-like [Pecten maximus]XP_033752095.1 nucleolar protein dao-5-like [Pecten maximus]XP_033752096.1 nucleolar protein dao-5-like [Pecten maximus]